MDALRNNVWVRWLRLRRGRMSDERRLEVTEEIVQMSVPSFEFYLLTMIATVTAAFGLLADSTAVVIGAMLLAPLMGPIFGIALAIANTDEALLLKSLRSEALGVAGAIGLSWLIGISPYRPDFGPNILARTQPTIYDLMIAFAAGLGGSVGLINPRVTASLPGVAIAVALLPPLATVGLCLAAGWWAGAGGAMLLFFANFLAIAFMSTVTFYFAGLSSASHRSEMPRQMAYRSLVVTLALLLGIGIFLSQTLLGIVEEQQLQRKVRQSLTRAIALIPGTELSELNLTKTREDLRVAVVMLVAEPIEPSLVSVLEQRLIADLRQPVNLVIRSLISEDYDSSGPIYLTQDLTVADPKQEAETLLLKHLTQSMQDQLVAIPGAELVTIRWKEQEETLAVTATVRTPTALSPAQIAAMQPRLSLAAGRPATLTIRSMLTRDANAQSFLYDSKITPSPAAQALRARIADAVETQLFLLDSRIEFLEVHYGLAGDRLRVLVLVEAPFVVSAEQVSQVEAGLREDLTGTLDLAIRTAVGAEMTPAGIDSDPGTNFLARTVPEHEITSLPTPPKPDILPSNDGLPD